MSGLRVLIPAVSVAVAGALSACAGGPSSSAEVCTAFDDLGGTVHNVNGFYDVPVFRHAGDLGDLAVRYRGGADLGADADALHRIASGDTTSVAELKAATGDIARLCGHDLLGVATSGGVVVDQGTTEPADPADPTTTEPDQVPAEPSENSSYQRLTGPGGVSVEVPGTWRDGAGSSTYRQVGEADPAGAFARFGGYRPTGPSVLAEITAGERSNPNIRPGYHRISLSATTFQGGEAVDWRFTFVKAGVTRQVHGLYWRTGGTEYLIYLSGPDGEWPALDPVFEVMRTSVAT